MRAWPAVPLPAPAPGERPAVQVHDTASGRLQEVSPAGGPARMYVCGITPYDATHLGHAATYLAFDTLNRVWRDAGHDVLFVENATDVDEPLLDRAARDGQDWTELAEREIALFRDDMAALRVVPPEHFVGAVEAMEEIARFVDALRAAGVTYELDGDVYFSVDASARFGEVAGLDQATMLALSAERGGDPQRPGKKNPLDALLWLAPRPGEPSWDGPVGPGRPGWHVECAAIAVGRLGACLDVQGGGSDLAFPHHEHSAVEAAAVTGQWPFARAYVHAGMIGLDGEKMSKSRGNLVFVSRLRAAGTDPMALRLALLAGHYRQDRTWRPDLLDEAQARLRSWREAAARPAAPPAGPVVAALRRCLYTDLDTPGALAAVDAWAAGSGTDPAAAGEVAAAVDGLLGVPLPG